MTTYVAEERKTNINCNLDTDASVFQYEECKVSTNETRQAITVQQIEELERDMDIYQKVSLVFLLYPEVNLALQRLQAVEAHMKSATHSLSLNEICLLSDWARTLTRENGKCFKEISDSLSSDSERALVEALSIVQDFESLVRLGRGSRYSGLVTREMSLKTPEKFCVNYTRNVLYRLCEDIHPLVTEELVKRVEIERPDLVRRYPPNARLLEIVLLHWASQGFIKINDGTSVDVRNISKHLLILGESEMARMLDTCFPYEPKSSEIEESRDVSSETLVYEENSYQLQNPASDKVEASLPLVADDHAPKIDSEINEEQKFIPTKSTVKKIGTKVKKGIYEMNVNNMGFCIIVNQKNFHRERNPALADFLPENLLEDRVGTDVDRDRLTEAFTSLGFNIQVKTNLRHDQLLGLARTVSARTDLEKHSCFVFCILSHGQKDVVYGCNSIPVEIMDLVETFCGSKCPALIGKPKIFIIQACQGSKVQKTVLSNVDTDGPSKTLAGVKDYVKFLSTVPGYVSLRHKVTGSWFIDNLCEEIMCRDPDSSLIDVFTQVNAAVDKKSSVIGNSVVSMMSELRSTLRGPVHLPLDPESMRKAAIFAIQRALFDKLFEEFYHKQRKPGEVQSRAKWY